MKDLTTDDIRVRNVVEIAIENGIPIPKRRRRKKNWKQVILKMKPGQSFVVQHWHFCNAILMAAKRIGKDVTTRKLNGEGFRIWRVK